MPTRSAPRSLLLIAYFIFFAMAIPSGILNVAWIYMQGTFAVSFDSLAVLLLVNTCAGLISTFFSGRLIGRFGLGRYLVTGGVILAVGLSGYIVTPTWIMLLISSFVMTLGFSAFNAGLNLFISAKYSAGQFNWLHAAYGLGQTVGPSLATFIVASLGQSWRLSYAIVFVLILLALGLLFLTRARWIMPGEIKPGDVRGRVSLRESLLIPAVLLGMTTFFFSSGTISATGQLSSTLLTARGIQQAGFWISAYWASFTVGRIIMGFIAHRLDKGLLIRVCMIVAALGTLLLWQNASAALNLAGLAIIGLASAPMYPTLVALTHQRVESRYRANAVGFQIAAAGLGTSLVPGALAWLTERIGVGVIGITLLVGTLLVLALNEVALRRQPIATLEVQSELQSP